MTGPPNGAQPGGDGQVQPAPSPASWSLTKTNGTIGGQPVYAFAIRTLSGVTVTFWPADQVLRMARMLTEAVGGLTVAQELPPDPFLNR